MRQKILLIGIVGMLVSGAMFFIPGTATAHDGTVTVMSARLPTVSALMPAVWNGTYAYVFGGGVTGPSVIDEIVRYDPATDTATTMNAKFSIGINQMAAVKVGQDIYVFGGYYISGQTDEIVKYSPSTDTLTVMSARMPYSASMTNAVFDGTCVYLFGGWDAYNFRGEIWRYDPTSDTMTELSTRLPSPWRGQAVWDGQYVYLLGGEGSAGYSNQILRFNPGTGEIAPMSATLPESMGFTSALWSGDHVYVFGGGVAGGQSDSIFEYTPQTDSIRTLSARLPAGLATWGSAIWDGGAAYIFGGLRPAPARDSDLILKFTPEQPDFSLSATPSSRTVSPGGTTMYSVRAIKQGYFSDPITISATGLPAGVTAGFLDNPLTPPSSTVMTVSVGGGVQPGTYSITINGTGGGKDNYTSVNLIVPSGDFSVSAAPQSHSVVPGNNATYSVQLIELGTFESPVTLSATGLPAGVTASFLDNPLTPPSSTAMIISVGSSAQPGTYSITITGVGNGKSHSTAVNLTIEAIGSGSQPSLQVDVWWAVIPLLISVVVIAVLLGLLSSRRRKEAPEDRKAP
jgi:N-acetylneuraminic acid mutarotase